MIAAGQNIRHGHAVPFPGLGVKRVFQQAFLKTVLGMGLGIPHDPGEQALSLIHI